MTNKKLKPGHFYYWRDLDRIIGVIRIQKGRFDELFGCGFLIEDSNILKVEMIKRGKNIDRDFTVLNIKRAISQVKINCTNVYNAVMVHGKNVLDSTGNIDYEMFKIKEKELQLKLVGGIHIDINVTNPFTALKDIPSVEINLKKASELNLV